MGSDGLGFRCWFVSALLVACGQQENVATLSLDSGAPASPDATDPVVLLERLQSLVLPEARQPPADTTNAFARDPAAAELGRAFFFDPRFSGPLLASDNHGGIGTLGVKGDTGRVSCASCHQPEHRFADGRSTRGQLSLASGWTHRRTPSLLDVAEARLLTWDGRRDTSYSVVFGVIESPLEFNSSPLFVAQQIAAHYQPQYEAVFGPLPSLDAYEPLAPREAGCVNSLALDPDERCAKPGADDEAVVRVVVNFGKAIAAYVGLLSCGPSRFDEWMRGDVTALTPEEQAGAYLFVGRGGCDGCHTGPHLTDHRFYNVGVPGSLVPFTGVDTRGDRGAARALPLVLEDWLNSRGPFSDGDDGRLDELPFGESLEGAFRTPGLRCRSAQKSFFHNGEYRSLHDVVAHFAAADPERTGTTGTSVLTPLDLDREERDQLVAFLRALEGPGPAAELLGPP